jgi:hypothetical protein
MIFIFPTDDLVNLQYKDIKIDLRSRTEILYHGFSLIFWKTNKDHMKSRLFLSEKLLSSDGSIVQKYIVQIDTSHLEIDCYTQVIDWNGCFLEPIMSSLHLCQLGKSILASPRVDRPWELYWTM